MDNWYATARINQKDLDNEIVEFLIKNPKPSSQDLIQWAKDNGFCEFRTQESIYALLSSVINAGRAKDKGVTEDEVDAKELAKGVKVEKEHTTNAHLAKRIALDHLAEMPDYYTKLLEMEGAGGHD